MKALLVINLCKGLQKQNDSEIKDNILELVSKFTQVELPVFILKTNDNKENCIKDLEFGSYVVYAKDIDVFIRSNLEKKLRIMGVNEVVICGGNLDSSVLFSAIAAYDRGFKVTVVKDAVETESCEKIEDTILKLLGAGDIDVITSDQIIYGEVNMAKC